MTPPKLLDQVRERIRVKHYSLRTEEAYLHWIRRFIHFHGRKHPRQMAGPEVEAFLSHLATEGKVAASTQNQALSALLFLYRQVLGVDLPWLDGIVRAKRPQRLPVVLTEAEVRALLAQLDGTRWLAASLLYSSGMRLLEGLRLRVKDVAIRLPFGEPLGGSPRRQDTAPSFGREDRAARSGEGGARCRYRKACFAACAEACVRDASAAKRL